MIRTRHLTLGLFVIVQLLLFFGKNFTKFSLIGPLHLYDAMLIMLSLSSLYVIWKRGKVNVNIPFAVLLLLSIVYLIYSVFAEQGTLNHTFRQYALFAYPIIIWPIINAVRPDVNESTFIRFISWIVYASLFLQVFNHVYLMLTEGPDYRFFGEKNYLSLTQLIGMILAIPFALIFVKVKWKKIGITVFSLILLSSIGHASALLSGLTIVLVFMLKRLSPWLKVSALLVSGVLALFLYFKDSEYSDSNAEYRLIYWSQTLKESINDKYAILGSGFGGKYISKETLDRLNTEYKNPWMEVRPEEQYLTAMHNSFITAIFHVGLLPFLILGFMAVYKIILFYLKSTKEEPDRLQVKEFLSLSLVGVSVWVSFNMILELPHSSLIFWLLLYWAFLEFRCGRYLKFRKTN